MFFLRSPVARCSIAIAVLLLVGSTSTAGVVRHAKFTSDGKSVLVAYANGKKDGAIVLWDVATREARWIHRNQESGFTRVAVDPENPNIVYSQSQYGFLARYDKQSGEEVGIQPREPEGENAYRFNFFHGTSGSDGQPAKARTGCCAHPTV